METNLLFHELKSELISLGFSFYGDPSVQAADPERTLLQSLQFFYEDRKLFRMVLRWCLIAAPLIHVERLHKLCKNLDPKLVPILGALSKKMVLSGDRRFNLIYEDMKKQYLKGSKFSIPDGYADPFLLAKYGKDDELGEFGTVVAKIHPEDEKKILDLRGILKMNRWLKIRTLIGANFRADLIYWLTLKTIHNPNQAAKVLGCSRETAYRLWKEVSLFEDLERLVA